MRMMRITRQSISAVTTPISVIKKDIVGIVLFTEKEIPAYRLYIKKSFEEKKERVFFEKHLR